MASRLDHITVVAPSLHAGAAFVEAALGVAPGAGRQHPGMGTHNRLLALGPSVYLEVISVNPQAQPVARARWFGLDRVGASDAPHLAAWVASTDHMTGADHAELGEVETMRRDQHTWQMRVRADGRVPLDGAAPLLIQRAAEADPVAALPVSGLHFERLLIRHPSPERVQDVFARIGFDVRQQVAIERGDRCSLVAEIRTAHGLRRLGP